MKTCKTCGEEQSYDAFYKHPGAKDGYKNECKTCYSAKNRAKYVSVPRTPRKQGFRLLPEGMRKCSTCSEVMSMDNFYPDKRRASGVSPRCRRCTPSKVYNQRRRARKIALPDTLTSTETSMILMTFDSSCAICNEEYAHLDHFIPLSSGHGGTTYENIVPMCASHNLSKSWKNPFEWAKTLDSKEFNRFTEVTHYLAVLNGLSVEDYEIYVTNCFN